MRPAAAQAAGRRRFGFGVTGGGGGGDQDPDVEECAATSGNTCEFTLDHLNRNRYVLIMHDVTTQIASGGDQYVMEFRRASDTTWEQGASSYQWMELGTSFDIDTTLDVNMPLLNCENTVLNAVFYISGGGLAVPTQVIGRHWRGGSNQMKDCTMRNADLHDKVRIRTEGAKTFVSGTIYLIRME